jgi:hypothetical protein
MDELEYRIVLEDGEGNRVIRTTEFGETWPGMVAVFIQMLRGMGYQIACCAEDVVADNLMEFHHKDREERNGEDTVTDAE